MNCLALPRDRAYVMSEMSTDSDEEEFDPDEVEISDTEGLD
jgi:hypothetical protein